MPLWEAGGGVSPIVVPDYRGSDQYRGYVLPFPHIVYRGEKLKIFKLHRRKHYRKTQGHRQNYTEIQISGISL